MFDYSSESSENDEEDKLGVQLTSMRQNAASLIYNRVWKLHNTTRNFAMDLCLFSCAYFDREWHNADWQGFHLKLSKRMQDRFGPCKESCLSNAYGKTEIFDGNALTYTTKCVAAACIVLASLICLDTFITEQKLASHLFANYFNSAEDEAKKIRHYSYFIFCVLCDGCPSRVPSVQNEFVVCQNVVFGPGSEQACEMFRHEGVNAMLQTISDNRELRRRYSVGWMAKCCTILSVIVYTKNYFTKINCKRQYLQKFGECLIDCALVCQLADRHTEKFFSFYRDHFSIQQKKRLINGDLKMYIRQKWIRELFQKWNIKEMYEKRKLGRQNPVRVTLCTKPAWDKVGIVQFNPQNSSCPLEIINETTSNIGVGGYGSVSRMNFIGETVAVKNFLSPTEYGPWLNDVSDAIQEINALRYFEKTKGILKMRAAFFKFSQVSQEIKEIQMCMPLYKCDLHSWIQAQQDDKGYFCFNSIDHFSSIVVQLANGLHEIHKAGFMHRDIKTLNILLSQNEKQVVWSDLGAALSIFNGSAHEQRMRDGATYWWRAPELLIQEGKKPYITSTASEIWSFGACIVEMITGKVPFEVDNCILDLHLQQCSFTLDENAKDEFGILQLCKDLSLPVGGKTKSQLRKRVYTKLAKQEQTKKRAKDIANFIFYNILHLFPSRRASAQTISQFFSNLCK